MGRSISQWFNDTFRKPKHEVLAYAVMLSWHPSIGFAAHDPLTGRHFSHRPGTTVINNFSSPSKLAADYFPATPLNKPQLPRHIYGEVQYTHSLSEVRHEGNPVMVERYELRNSDTQAFIFQRRLHPDGYVELEASYGNLRNSHADKPHSGAEHTLNTYLDSLRTFARRMLTGSSPA